jgi:hypothetical protein
MCPIHLPHSGLTAEVEGNLEREYDEGEEYRCGRRDLGYRSYWLKGNGGSGISMIILNCGRRTEHTMRQTKGHRQGCCEW